MKRIICATLLATTVLFMGACGNSKNTETPMAEEFVTEEISAESAPAENKDTSDTASEVSTESDVDESLSELEAIGDVDVDKGVFNVTITVPKDFVGETTQEDIDKSVQRMIF